MTTAQQNHGNMIAQLEQIVAGNQAFYKDELGTVCKGVYIHKNDSLNKLSLNNGNALFIGNGKETVEIVKIERNDNRYFVKKLNTLPSETKGCFVIFTPISVYSLDYNKNRFIKYNRKTEPSLKKSDFALEALPASVKKYYAYLMADILLSQSLFLKEGKNIQQLSKYDQVSMWEKVLSIVPTTGLPNQYSAYFNKLRLISRAMKDDFGTVHNNAKSNLVTGGTSEKNHQMDFDVLAKNYPAITMEFESLKFISSDTQRIYKLFNIDKPMGIFATKLANEGNLSDREIQVETMKAAANILRHDYNL